MDIKFKDIFNIVEAKNRKGQVIYRLQLRYSGQILTMCNRLENVKPLGERWIKKNLQKAADMVFELEVLEVNNE